MEYKTDILIIGAGPVGLFGVFQAGMLGMKTLVVDSLDFIGGQCSALYPEKPIYDIPAHPMIAGQDLVEHLSRQAMPFNPTYLLGQQVVEIERVETSFIVKTSANNIIQAKVIIIAAGCGAFGPNKPPIAHIEEYEGRSVFYLVNKREDFRDKTLVIAGGGDSAVDWAISLSGVAKKIYMVHRRDKFRALDNNVEQMKLIARTGKIEFLVPYQVVAIKGDNGMIVEVELESLNGDKLMIAADVFLPFFGLRMELGPVANWGLQLEQNHIVVNHSSMMTSERGIYAAGDIAKYAGKLKLILCGFSEIATACHDAYSIVNEGKALHFEYSTTKGLRGNP